MRAPAEGCERAFWLDFGRISASGAELFWRYRSNTGFNAGALLGLIKGERAPTKSHGSHRASRDIWRMTIEKSLQDIDVKPSCVCASLPLRVAWRHSSDNWGPIRESRPTYVTERFTTVSHLSLFTMLHNRIN